MKEHFTHTEMAVSAAKFLTYSHALEQAVKNGALEQSQYLHCVFNALEPLAKGIVFG